MSMQLFCNGLTLPLAIDGPVRFSWREGALLKEYRQISYRLRVATSVELLDCPDVWDSGEVQSELSVDVELPVSLKSSCRYYWDVAVTDRKGDVHKSGSSWFETGLLRPEDWKGQWITAGNAYITNWAMLFRREFSIYGRPEKAKAYVSGLGCCELYLNGEKVGDHVLDPAQTEYPQKVFYSAYDLTEKLQKGANTIGVILGDGWYHQSQLMEGNGIYGEPCLMFQLEIQYEGGTTQYVVSDGGWRVSRSAISMNNIYVGETYDARLEQPGWCTPGFAAYGWTPAVPDTVPKGVLSSQQMPPMRITEEIRPVSIAKPCDGVFVLDMGKNFAGVARLHIFGTPGNEIVMRFGEAVDSNGHVDVDSSGVFHIRGVQTLRYIFGKRGEITWQPRFCYFSFRYVEITGAHADITLDCLTGLKLHTDLRPVSQFQCSMPILNQMEQLFRNTFTSNIHGLPTDCPAREKCGWTGDANIISDSAMTMYDGQQFWAKYVEDIIAARKEYGIYNNIVPGKRACGDTVPAWGTALITIPWNLYQFYGNQSVLADYYGAMADYIAYMEQNTTNYHYNRHHYELSDWCAPYDWEPGIQFVQMSDLYYYRSLVIMEKTASLLEKTEEALRYGALAQKVRQAFLSDHYDWNEHTFGTQSLNAYCIEEGMYPEGEDKAIAKWCADDIVRHDNHITCGHIGIRYIYRVLTRYGYFELLEKVLNSHTYPSFGAMLDMGATTLWESFELRFHGQSLSHPFKGSYCLWLYEDVLGIQKNSPGGKTFTVKPLAASMIPWAKGSVETPYGVISVDYKVGDYFHVIVPSNTTATVFVPQEDGAFVEHHLESGEYQL